MDQHGALTIATLRRAEFTAVAAETRLATAARGRGEDDIHTHKPRRNSRRVKRTWRRGRIPRLDERAENTNNLRSAPS
jgi:hypothetical protein